MAGTVTNPACGDWWAMPADWSYGDPPPPTTFSGNASFDLAALGQRCGCFIFALHNAADCDLGIISYLGQSGSFDASAILATMAFIMSCVSALRTASGLALHHSFMRWLPFQRPTMHNVRHRWKEGWRGWLFHTVLFLCALNIARSKLVFTFRDEVTARRMNILITSMTDVLFIVMLLLLHGAWFFQQTMPGGGMTNVYVGPRRPPKFLRALSVLGLVCDDPAACRAHNGPGHVPDVWRVHLHDRRTRMFVGAATALLSAGLVAYPVMSIVVTIMSPVEWFAGQWLMVAKSPQVTRRWFLAFEWYLAGACVFAADMIGAILLFNTFGLGGVFPVHKHKHKGSAKKEVVTNADGDKPADAAARAGAGTVDTGGDGPAARKSADVAPGAAGRDDTATEPRSRRLSVAERVTQARALFVARARWLKTIGLPKPKPNQACPGRVDAEAAVDASWLLLILSFFPIAKAAIAFAIVPPGTYCPYTTSQEDPRGDPYEEPWFDAFGIMQFLAATLLFTFDSFPRKLTTSIVNFTDNAALVRREALMITRLLSLTFALLFTLYYRFAPRPDADLLDELLLLVAFFITLATLEDVRIGVVLALPWSHKTSKAFRRANSRVAGSCFVGLMVILLFGDWFWAVFFPPSINRINRSSRIGINLGIVLFPIVFLGIIRGTMALMKPPVGRTRVAALDPQFKYEPDASGAVFARASRWELLDDWRRLMTIGVAAFVVWTLVLSTLSLLLVYGTAMYVTGLVVAHMLRDDSVYDGDDQSSEGAGSRASRSSIGDVELTAVSMTPAAPTPAEPGLDDSPTSSDPADAELGSGDEGGSDDGRRKIACCRDGLPCEDEGRRKRAKRRLKMTCAQLFVACFMLLITHVWYFNVDPLPQYNHKPLIIGHRGVWKAGVPEISYQAADVSRAAGFDGVEFDVRLSKDHVPVLMHDTTVDRTTNGTGNVWDYTLAELRTLSLTGGDPDRHETVYTLDEYLLYLKERDLIAEVELKQGNDPVILPLTLDAVCRANMTERSFIATAEFTYQNLLWAMAPGMSMEKDWLYHNSAQGLSLPQMTNIVGIAAEFLMFNPWVITTAHRSNAAVMVYFLVTESEGMYRWLLSIGVDMLMINDDQLCIDSGLCPSPNQTVARVMCDNPDGTGACATDAARLAAVS